MHRILLRPLEMACPQFIAQDNGRCRAQTLEQHHQDVLYGGGNGDGSHCLVPHAPVCQGVHGCAQPPHELIGNDRGGCPEKLADEQAAPAKQLPDAAGHRQLLSVHISQNQHNFNNSGYQGSHGSAGYSHGRRAELAEYEHVIQAYVNHNGDTAAYNREYNLVHRPEYGHIYIGHGQEGVGQNRYLQVLCPQLHAVMAGSEYAHDGLGGHKGRYNEKQGACQGQQNGKPQDLPYAFNITVSPELGRQYAASADNAEYKQRKYKEKFIGQSHCCYGCGPHGSNHQGIHQVYHCVEHSLQGHGTGNHKRLP